MSHKESDWCAVPVIIVPQLWSVPAYSLPSRAWLLEARFWKKTCDHSSSYLIRLYLRKVRLNKVKKVPPLVTLLIFSLSVYQLVSNAIGKIRLSKLLFKIDGWFFMKIFCTKEHFNKSPFPYTQWFFKGFATYGCCHVKLRIL